MYKILTKTQTGLYGVHTYGVIQALKALLVDYRDHVVSDLCAAEYREAGAIWYTA